MNRALRTRCSFFHKVLVASAIVTCTIATRSAFAATFTVNTISDTDGLTNCVAPNPCSLREAIREANHSPGSDDVAFAIPPGLADPIHGKYSIVLTDSLPPIVEEIHIDGTTQPGFVNEPLIEISGDPTSHLALYLADHTGSSIRGLILNSLLIGIGIESGGGHHVAGNWLGPDATGLLPEPNTFSVYIDGSEDNVIGGETAADRNLISGNSDASLNRYFGILLVDQANHNRIEGNWIGLDKTGLAALPNNGEGILIFDSHSNVIGGSPSKRNIISAVQKQQAVQVEGAPGNTVSYNCFGTNKDCAIDGGNPFTSPFANGVISPHATIDVLTGDSQTLSADDNVIAHNVLAQSFGHIRVLAGDFGFGGDNTVRGTVIHGNTMINSVAHAIFVHTQDLNFDLFPEHVDPPSTVEGTRITDNTIQNSLFDTGILLLANVSDTHIEGNTIGNVFAGIAFLQNVTDSRVTDNRIGLDEDGNPAPNFWGIAILPVHFPDPIDNFVNGIPPIAPSSHHRIEGNTIANNFTGILLGSDIDQFLPDGDFDPSIVPDETDASTQDVTVIGNAIHSNVLLGIDLTVEATDYGRFVTSVEDGPTPNEPRKELDADSGANDLQNYPELLQAKVKAEDQFILVGRLSSEANQRYRIDVYLNDSLDPSGYGEGEHPVGHFMASTNNSGQVTFAEKIDVDASELPVDVELLGLFATATATKLAEGADDDDEGALLGTSEFSQGILLVEDDPELGAAPDPSRAATRLSFALPTQPEATNAAYDVAYRQLSRLASGSFAPGRHEVVWDGRHAGETTCAPWLYLDLFESATARIPVGHFMASTNNRAQIPLAEKIDLEDSELPDGLELLVSDPGRTSERPELGAAPNPFRAATRISFALPSRQEAAIAVYDVAGRQFRRLASGSFAPGRHEVVWDGRDADGATCAPGIYLLRFESATARLGMKLVRIR